MVATVTRIAPIRTVAYHNSVQTGQMPTAQVKHQHGRTPEQIGGLAGVSARKRRAP